ncbi:hypothetical protein [Microvirga calopogonii]|uniref:hypothetical protein n=1 Tax=Microvirga calopogonii TaxID=2078013 RepID=UPI000E0DC607|nr:hypothetical protein [Microvirga calopogonii]
MASKSKMAEREAMGQEAAARFMMERYGFAITSATQYQRLPDGTTRKHLITLVDGIDSGLSTVHGANWDDVAIYRRITGRFVEQPIPEGSDWQRHSLRLLEETGLIPSKEERRRRIEAARASAPAMR